MEDLVAWKKKDDFQARRLSIIDFSSEDDSLLGSSPGFLQDDASAERQGQGSVDVFEPVDDNKLEELFEPVDLNKLQEIPEADESVPQPSECLEPEMVRKNGKYNLRTSLAWDSAFFTCEGVLDAEELSSMISVDKSQKRMLPGIQEEVHRSTDSISTLESDTLTLESVETSLFDDVRASIQRSRKPIKMGESSKVGLGVREAKVGTGLKNLEFTSQTKLKPKVPTKKPSISMQNPGKLPRPVHACPQLSQAVAVSGESTPSVLKKPKVLDKPIPSSTRVAKRASLGGDLLKVEKDSSKTVARRATPVPKLPGTGSLRNVPRPSKSSSLAASSTITAGTTSSIDSSGSTLSVKSGKSPNLMKRTDCRTGNPTNSSRSNPKTPSRIVSGDKIEFGKSRLSAQFMPSPKLSSSISPASSISDWSSESVSSISSTHQISCSSMDSLSRSYSSKRVPMDFEAAQTDHDDQSSAGSATRVTRLSGQGSLKASVGMVALPPTSKPSGLRLPSPKLGFFDGVKSAVRTPKRNLQSNPVAPSNLPKGDASAGNMSPRGSGIKSKLGKVNPEKSAISAKPDAQASLSNMKPKSSSSQEASKAATKEVKSCPNTSLIVKTNLLLKLDQEHNSKAEEGGNGGHDVGLWNKDIGFSENKIPDVLKVGFVLETKHSSAHKEDVKITGLSNLSTVSDFENVKCSEESAKDTNHVEAESKNGKAISDPEDHMDCLIRQLGAMVTTRTQGTLSRDDTLTSHQKFSGEEDNGGVSQLNSQLDSSVFTNKDSPNSLSKPIVSISPASDNSDSSSKRIPLSAKDSLCNIGVSFDVSKGSTASEGEKNSQLSVPPFSEEHFD